MTSAQAPLPALSIRLPILSVLSVLSFSPLPRLAPFSARRHASICQVLLSLAAADVPPGSDGRTDSQTYEISYPAPSSGFPFSILVYFPDTFPFVPLFLSVSLSLFFSRSRSLLCALHAYIGWKTSTQLPTLFPFCPPSTLLLQPGTRVWGEEFDSALPRRTKEYFARGTHTEIREFLLSTRPRCQRFIIGGEDINTTPRRRLFLPSRGGKFAWNCGNFPYLDNDWCSGEVWRGLKRFKLLRTSVDLTNISYVIFVLVHLVDNIVEF